MNSSHLPVTITSVLAAFLSRFASIVSLDLLNVENCEVVAFRSLVDNDVLVSLFATVVDGLTFDAPLYAAVVVFSGDTEECSGVDWVIVNAVDSSRGLLLK